MSSKELPEAAQKAWGTVMKLAHGPIEPIAAASAVLKEGVQTEDGIPTLPTMVRDIEPVR